MNRYIICICLVLICNITTSQAAELYVATDGNDVNNGSISNPFRTLSKAATVAVAGDIVNIREGVYEETLRPLNSGTSARPIVFQSYQNEKVVISAMQSVDDWTRNSGDVYKASVTWDLGQSNFVMHESQALDLARWPNNVDGEPFTQDTVRNTGGTSGSVINGAYLDYAPGIPDIAWENGGSMYFYGDKPGAGWLAWKVFISSSNATRVGFDLVKNPSWIRSAHSPADFGNFFLEGVRGALDYQNEWFLDSVNSTLYLQLPAGAAPQNGAVKMRRRMLTIDLHNRDYIQIKNLAVFGGSINVTGNASFNTLSGISSYYGNYTRGVFTGFASGAQSVHLHGNNNTLEHSEIAFGSGSGVRDSGTANKLINSYVHDFNLLGSYDAAVLARGGTDSIIRQNTITRAGRDAVQAINRNLKFSYNDVSYSNLIADDCALLYTIGGPVNMEIDHNWFHDAYSPGSKSKAAGIYLDNDATAFKVHHNVVWNTEWSNIQINWDGTDIDVFNNTFVNGSQTMGAWHKAGTQFSNVRVWNNLSDQNQWEPQSDKQNNLTYTQDPFVDLSNGDFMLKANSQPINKGRLISGITTDITDGVADIGAYEFGGTRWLAGVDWDIQAGAAGLCYGLPGEVCSGGDSPPPPPAGDPIQIPALIEAEVFTAQSGVQTQVANDNGAAVSVAFINASDFIEFDVNVVEAGSYQMSFRLASGSAGGDIAILLGGNNVGAVSTGNTGGWQSWNTVQTTVQLQAGRQTLRLLFSQGGATSSGYLMNLNWVNVTTNPGVTPDIITEPNWYIVPMSNGKTVVFGL